MGICLAVWLVPSSRTGLTRVEDSVNSVSNLCQLGYFPSLVCPSAKRSDFVTVLIFLRPETRNTFTKGWSEAYPLTFKVIKQLYQNPVAVEIDGSSLLKTDGMDLPATSEDPSLTGNNDQ